MRRWRLLLCIAFLGFLGCGSRELTAEEAALFYCDCMEDKGAPEDYVAAARYCSKELAGKSRFYFLMEKERASRRSIDLPKPTRDSMTAFWIDFYDGLIANCCRTTLMCPDPAHKVVITE